MNGTAQASAFYVGGDVGGWNCDKNANSRDAIVMLATGLPGFYSKVNMS